MVVMAGMIPNISAGSKSQQGCKEDYSPCLCIKSSQHSDTIFCMGISLTDISGVFKAKTKHWHRIHLVLSKQDANKTIPADLVSDHDSTEIVFQCPSPNHLLKMDPKTFQASQNSASIFYSGGCDLSQLNFKFLTGFEKLAVLYFNATQNFHLIDWTTLPTLPQWRELHVELSTDLNKWIKFPNVTHEGGLKRLYLDTNAIKDATMDRILNWIEKSSAKSANILERLSLNENYLTRVPRQIKRFTKMKKLTLDSQKVGIHSLAYGAFHFSNSTTATFSAKYNKISKIYPGAFKGAMSFLVLFNRLSLILCL